MDLMANGRLHEAHLKEGSGRLPPIVPWVAAGLLAFSLAVFLLATPPGLLPKVDMVGYAVCHQIESHTFSFAGSHLPLCARCTGTFLGALVGLLGQASVLRRGRAGGFPPPPILTILIGFTGLWAADGLNSYLALVGGPHLYQPTNEIRLITGALNGLTISALVYPVFTLSVWRQPTDTAAIRGFGDLAVLAGLEAIVVGLVLSQRSFLLYPLALSSAVAVVVLLASVNTVLAVILLGQENTAKTWRQAMFPTAVGVLLSLVQIGLIDLMRFAITGTLEGIPTLQ